MNHVKQVVMLGLAAAVLLQSAPYAVYAEAADNGGRTTPSGISYDAIGTEIEAYVKEREEGLASCEVAVFCGDETLYEGYFGYADMEAQIAADENTVYEWASCSKLLVWTSVMQLVERGKLDLGADIRTYLPEGFLRKLQYEDESITMLHLMSHTAGWQESIYENQQADEKDIDDLETTLREKEPYQAYHPGEYTAYSNYGTALAAYIVQCVSRMDYADYVHENIFRPLGMEHTSVSAHRTDNMWVRGQREKLHTYIIAQDYYEHYGTGTAWVQFYPAGAATGTLSDLLAFAKTFTSADCPLFQDPKTRELMFTATSFYGDTDIVKNCHGLWTAEYGVQTMGHAGNSNCSSMVQFDPASGLGVVIMTNEAGETAFNYGIPLLLFGSCMDSGRLSDGGSDGSARQDISGVYLATRSFPCGVAKIMKYTGGVLPLGRSADEDVYKVSLAGMEFIRIADRRWIQRDGNGTEMFLYESVDKDGSVKLEMMSQDLIRDRTYPLKLGAIVLFYLLGIGCAVTLAVKLVRGIIRKARKKTRGLAAVDKVVLAEQFIFALTAAALIKFNFFISNLHKPVVIACCAAAALFAAISVFHAGYLPYVRMRAEGQEKRAAVKTVLWSLASLFYAGFIVYFQLYNFWNC